MVVLGASTGTLRSERLQGAGSKQQETHHHRRGPQRRVWAQLREKLGTVGSPEGPECSQSPVCTGTSEEGPPNKSLSWGCPKARRLRQLAHLVLPLPMVPSVAHNGQAQLEPASKDHPQDQPPGAEGRVEKARNGWGGSHNQHRGLRTVQISIQTQV